MPFAIRSSDKCKFEVYNKDTDAVMGCASSQAKAEAMIAIMMRSDEDEDEGKAGEDSAESVKLIPFEVKATPGPGEPPGFSGLGGAFHNLDMTGDIIAPGAFKASLARFLDTGVIGGLNHDWNNPIGHPVEAKETPEGLWIKAVLDDSDDARNALAKMRINPTSGRATIRRLSIGYKARDAQALDSDGVKSYWAAHGYSPDNLEVKALQARRGARLLKAVDLYEISPVTVPANDRAVILAAKCGCNSTYKVEPAPEPGTDFAQHSLAVVSAVEGFVGRAESRSETRFKVGRVLSQANFDNIKAVAVAMSEAAAELMTLLERASGNGKAAAPVNPVSLIDQTEIGRLEVHYRDTYERPYLLGR